MRTVLILGNTGTLGNLLEKYFRLQDDRYTVYGLSHSLFDVTKLHLYENIDFSLYDYVINCIGITKGLIEKKSIPEVIQINSVFPHWLAERTKKLIHISTDCVFSGKIDSNKFNNIWNKPDADDLYGLSKRLGEPKNCMLIRSSFVGPSLKGNGVGLFDWIIRSKGSIKGYKNHLWNGITTLEFAKVLDKIMSIDNLYKWEIYHLANTSLHTTKNYLCIEINSIFDLKLNIESINMDECINRYLGTYVENDLFREHAEVKTDITTQLIELRKFMEQYYK
jgi:dTDP-4-dehydrorhamnose reductase